MKMRKIYGMLFGMLYLPIYPTTWFHLVRKHICLTVFDNLSLLIAIDSKVVNYLPPDIQAIQLISLYSWRFGSPPPSESLPLRRLAMFVVLLLPVSVSKPNNIFALFEPRDDCSLFIQSPTRNFFPHIVICPFYFRTSSSSWKFLWFIFKQIMNV